MTIRTIPLHSYTDDRGWLIENEDTEIKDSMKHFLVSTLKPGKIRGQHYHKKKKEWFLVLRGTIRFVFKNVKTLEVAETYTTSEKPEMVEAEPLVSHAFENVGTEEAMLLAIVNEPLDKDNPDTFPYKVL